MGHPIAILFSLLTCLMMGCHPSGKPSPFRWAVYYGPKLSVDQLKGVDLIVLDPDQINPLASFSAEDRLTTRLVGYLSVGEAEEYRWYWPRVRGKEFLVEKNETWKGDYRVDIRSHEWQQLLLEEVIPRILQQGYEGLFLDTIDTAPYLEGKDPLRYRGSTKALVQFIKDLRRKFPTLLIYPNNGLEMLGEYATDVNGVFVEDLYTHYDFVSKKTLQTQPEITHDKESLLDQFRTRYQKPVMTILYEKEPKSPLAQYGIKRAEEKGYGWYVTSVDLMSWGTTP